MGSWPMSLGDGERQRGAGGLFHAANPVIPLFRPRGVRGILARLWLGQPARASFVKKGNGLHTRPNDGRKTTGLGRKRKRERREIKKRYIGWNQCARAKDLIAPPPSRWRAGGGGGSSTTHDEKRRPTNKRAFCRP